MFNGSVHDLVSGHRDNYLTIAPRNAEDDLPPALASDSDSDSEKNLKRRNKSLTPQKTQCTSEPQTAGLKSEKI